MLNLKHSRYAQDFGPIEDDCTCTTCRPKAIDGGLGLTRAYIYHLAAKETVGAHLLTIHNVHHLLSLMRRAREAILQDRYPEFAREFFRLYFAEGAAPDWARDALKGVGIEV